MGDNPPEIRTGYLPNTILQRYHNTNLVDGILSFLKSSLHKHLVIPDDLVLEVMKTDKIPFNLCLWLDYFRQL
jgi:hypothetical protein